MPRSDDTTTAEATLAHVASTTTSTKLSGDQPRRRSEDTMQTMTLDEYKAAVKAQGVPHEHIAMKCPMCGVIQSGADLIAAGAGADFDAVEKYLALSCVGRFTGAGTPRKKPDGKPCNWTLGGLFSLHKLEVVTPDGKKHPRFELATPAEAQAHMAARVQQAA